MTRKLLISLAINVPWAVWIYNFSNYNPTLPDALEFLEPFLFHAMLWGSGAMVGLTLRLYYPDTTRWTHILLLSIIWGVSIIGAIAGLMFIFGIPVTVLVAMGPMRARNFWVVSGFLFLTAEIVGFALFIPMIRRALGTDDGFFTESLPVWLAAAVVGGLYALMVHWMVVVSERLKNQPLIPVKSEEVGAA